MDPAPIGGSSMETVAYDPFGFLKTVCEDGAVAWLVKTDSVYGEERNTR